MATMVDYPIDIEDVNAMDAGAFVAAFRDVPDATPWVAIEAEGERPFMSRDAMVSVFANVIAEGEPQRQMALLQAHPDLAARENLTDASAMEQRKAGLDRLTAAEHRRLTELNAAYRERFGFPFILAVRGVTKADVLTALEARLKNPPAAEFARALVEVQRIVRFRIEDRVAP
jgi:2-oxo-4-hydroxy-4-carboxy-5-ureidoimidazoline decarboxylase